jgi:hypothetical protein
MSHKEEQKRILKVYADRKAQEKSKSALESEFIRHVVLERERVYARILSSAFSSWKLEQGRERTFPFLFAPAFRFRVFLPMS